MANRYPARRPQTLKEVANSSHSLEEFGLNLREWIHHIQRNDISNRPALLQRLQASPPLLNSKFPDGAIADAYLAAYAEWIADQAKIPRPAWTREKQRILQTPWFSDNARASLLILTPASFRQRNLFTLPENPVSLRRGRPSVSPDQLKAKAAARSRNYRQRMRKLIQQARS